MEHYLLNNLRYFEHLHLGLFINPRGGHLSLNFHDHDFSELAVILEGSNVLHLANHQQVELQVGDVLLLHPGMLHAYQHNGDLLIANVLFDTSRILLPGLDAAESVTYKLITQPDAESHIYQYPIAHLDAEAFAEAQHLLKNLDSELKSNHPARNLISYSLFMQIVGLVVRAGNPALPPDFRGAGMDAVQYINENFTQKITVAQLAKLSHLSERDFYRKFRTLTGMTPLEYKRKKQLELAANLLRDSQLSISEIADKCGFCDSNHLTREFSDNYRLPPGKFRKKYTKQPLHCPTDA